MSRIYNRRMIKWFATSGQNNAVLSSWDEQVVTINYKSNLDTLHFDTSPLFSVTRSQSNSSGERVLNLHADSWNVKDRTFDSRFFLFGTHQKHFLCLVKRFLWLVNFKKQLRLLKHFASFLCGKKVFNIKMTAEGSLSNSEVGQQQALDEGQKQLPTKLDSNLPSKKGKTKYKLKGKFVNLLVSGIGFFAGRTPARLKNSFCNFAFFYTFFFLFYFTWNFFRFRCLRFVCDWFCNVDYKSDCFW